MPWVRLDDGYPEHPKVDRVGPLAAWLNVCAWAYSARNLTDGFVPAERVPRLATVPKPQHLAERLVEANLWEPASAPCAKCTTKRNEAHAPAVADGGFLVHDYLVYNPSREQVLKERAETAQRVADHRARRNGVTPPDGNGGGNPVGNGVTNGVSTDPPVPAPVRPQNLTESPKAATQLKAPAVSFSEGEQAVVDAVGIALAQFGFRLEPRLWRKVLDGYPGIDLEAEAYKQADWMHRNRIKTCSATRYTNWLDKAHPKITPIRSDDHPGETDREYIARTFAHLGATA